MLDQGQEHGLVRLGVPILQSSRHDACVVFDSLQCAGRWRRNVEELCVVNDLRRGVEVKWAGRLWEEARGKYFRKAGKPNTNTPSSRRTCSDDSWKEDFLPEKKEYNIPNGVPAHIMALGAHESHNIGLLFLVHRRVHLHDSLEEVFPDVFPLRHCCDCEKVKYCCDVMRLIR